MIVPLRYALVIPVLLLVSMGIWLIQKNADLSGSGTPFASLATCFAMNGNMSATNPACLRNTVHQLLQGYTADEILRYASADSSTNSLRMNCHDIGHVVGEELFAKEGSLEPTLGECSRLCNNGCLHGAIAADILKTLGRSSRGEDIVHADIGAITKIAAPYCKSSTVLCHGIGHVLYMSSHDISKSLGACEQIATGSSRESCFQGIFMESFGSELSLNFSSTSIAVDPEQYAYPCASFSPSYQHACFRYLPGLHMAQSGASSTIQAVRQKNLTGCSPLAGATRAYCYEGIGYDGGISQGDLNDYPGIQAICLSLQIGQERNACIWGLVQKYVYYDDASGAQTVCASLETAEKDVCENFIARASVIQGEKS
jgi:hypothetical protein